MSLYNATYWNDNKEGKNENLYYGWSRTKKQYCLIDCSSENPSKMKNVSRPEQIQWFKIEERNCWIVEISTETDIDIKRNIGEKENNPAELLRNLQVLYPDYNFRFIAVIFEVLEYVARCLNSTLETLGFWKRGKKKLIDHQNCNSVSNIPDVYQLSIHERVLTRKYIYENKYTKPNI